ncbi:MAG TPA: PP2C family protein-serine/threonine phosphatase [Nocardioidaceae bacterium]|nr:PP2C family protein-serine/threonine phosphatase [Nocardioidaceae bacterium]
MGRLLGREDRNGALLGSAWCLALFTFDVLEGPTPQVVGQTAVAPMLAGVLAGPRAVVAAGAVALGVTAIHGAMFDFATTPSQLIRLAVIATATVVGALVAVARRRGQEQLAVVEAVAEAAQSAILRPSPTTRAAEVAVSYSSAQQRARVGGDAYEVQETPHGLRVLVADARGKGLPAVRLASAVLGAFREAAHRLPCLAEVAAAMDVTVRREGEPEDFVTAVLAEYADGRLTLVNCGHPDPLLLGPGRSAAIEPPRRWEPLGLLPGAPEAWHADLTGEDVVLLYTDGVVEGRDATGAEFDLARAATGSPTEHLPALLDTILAALRRHTGGTLTDDLAMVALRPAGA